MAAKSLKTRILFSFFAIMLAISLAIALLGVHVIKMFIVEKAEQKIRDDLEAVQLVYTGEIQRIGDNFRIVSFDGDSRSECSSIACSCSQENY